MYQKWPKYQKWPQNETYLSLLAVIFAFLRVILTAVDMIFFSDGQINILVLDPNPNDVQIGVECIKSCRMYQKMSRSEKSGRKNQLMIESDILRKKKPADDRE